ncbi:homoserine dehydrogenase [Thermoplasma sp. Kam2015]|uniref:homoserine dehydrogenase n=1 Tax=Thermoplasma sp. Kam2015 TaxID=2094122 RepID=UPI000D88E762|nr:homoserine dehydrogenase [Thermoplasma sp. Kam2015]PYB67835.1 homoserine dehydrogenase [Thermoplasma sp. Kam2015]
MKEIKVILMGVGNVGLNVLRILQTNNERNGGLNVRLVGVSDSHSSVSGKNLNIQDIIRNKELNGRVSNNAEIDVAELLKERADILVDCTPASRDGSREADLYKMAFQNGLDVVTANKSGLANRWKDIMDSAKKYSRKIRYEATVAGGVPLFSILDYSIIPSRVIRFRGIVSSTINYVIRNMARGAKLDQVVDEAIRKGIAERNPQDDLKGLDAGRKSVILVNRLFGTTYTLKDVRYEGVKELPYGENDRLITEVYEDNGKPVAISRIASLSEDDFLRHIDIDGLGYQIITDNNGTVNVSDISDGPYETAGAVVNDIFILSNKS